MNNLCPCSAILRRNGHVLVLIVSFWLTPVASHGQTPSPPYLREMPSVERVMREVTGSDAKQTALLQLQAFYELGEIIKTLAGPREYTGLTPDENKWIQTYRQAGAHLAQESDKAFPGPYGNWKRFSLNVAMYPSNYPDFAVETQLFKRFFSPAVRAAFEKELGIDAARHQAFVEAEQRAYAAANARASGGDAIANANAAALGNIFSGNSRDTVALRRCLELGHNQLECTGKGLVTSLGDLIGMDLGQSHVKAGLTMSGIYKNQAGFSLMFHDDSVDLYGCGDLVGESHKYVVGKKGGQLLVQIASEPQAFILALGLDGKFSGPAATSIDGRVITGYRSQYVAASPDPQPYGTAAHYAQVPVYAPKTERCQVAVLYPVGSTTTFASATAQTVGIFSGQSVEEAQNAAQKVAPPPGPRMEGEYAGQSGLKVGFQTDAAILDCGEAHVAKPYTVQNMGGQIVITLQNGGVNVPMTLQPDGSLSGSGTVDVAGRIMTGMTSAGPAFAQMNARCAMATLRPQ